MTPIFVRVQDRDTYNLYYRLLKNLRWQRWIAFIKNTAEGHSTMLFEHFLIRHDIQNMGRKHICPSFVAIRTPEVRGKTVVGLGIRSTRKWFFVLWNVDPKSMPLPGLYLTVRQTWLMPICPTTLQSTVKMMVTSLDLNATGSWFSRWV